jgi:hypothetical protein
VIAIFEAAMIITSSMAVYHTVSWIKKKESLAQKRAGNRLAVGRAGALLPHGRPP